MFPSADVPRSHEVQATADEVLIEEIRAKGVSDTPTDRADLVFVRRGRKPEGLLQGPEAKRPKVAPPVAAEAQRTLDFRRPSWMTAHQQDAIVAWAEQIFWDGGIEPKRCWKGVVADRLLYGDDGRCQGAGGQFCADLVLHFEAHCRMEVNMYSGATRVYGPADPTNVGDDAPTRLGEKLPAHLLKRHPFNDHTQRNTTTAQQLWETLAEEARRTPVETHAVANFVRKATPHINAVFALVLGKKAAVVERRQKPNGEVEYESRTVAETLAMFNHILTVKVLKETFNKKGARVECQEVPTNVPVMKKWVANTNGRLQYQRRVFNPRETGQTDCASADEFNNYTGLEVPPTTETVALPAATGRDLRIKDPTCLWVPLKGKGGVTWQRMLVATLSKAHCAAQQATPYHSALAAQIERKVRGSDGNTIRSFVLAESRTWMEAQLARCMRQRQEHCSAVAASHAAVFEDKAWAADRKLGAEEEEAYRTALGSTPVRQGLRQRATVDVPSYATSTRVRAMIERHAEPDAVEEAVCVGHNAIRSELWGAEETTDDDPTICEAGEPPRSRTMDDFVRLTPRRSKPPGLLNEAAKTMGTNADIDRRLAALRLRIAENEPLRRPRCQSLLGMYAVRPFLDHLWSVWCANAPNAFPYVHRWIASTVQNPDFKVKVALVLKSRPRTGKGIVMELLAAVLGQRYVSQPARMEDVTEATFNEHLLGQCLLLFLDEAFWGGDKKVKGALKKLITEKMLNIGQKYEVGYLAENCFNLILASNEKHVVNMDIDSGKIVVLDCSNVYAGTTTNPAAKKRYMGRVRGTNVQALSNYLCTVDLTQWDPFDIPSTRGSTDQVARSFAPDLQFVVKVLNDPTVLSSTKVKSLTVFDGKSLDRSAVYALYKARLSHPESERSLWKTWRESVGALFPSKVLLNKERKPTRAIILPSLDEARENFRQFVGIADFPFAEVDASVGDICEWTGDDPWS